MSRIQPFSNLTEFTSWKDKNCDRCCRYENVSTKANNARCRLAFYLDLGSVSDGTISSYTALKIGCKSFNGFDGSCELYDQCKMFNIPIKKYPKKKKVDKRQTNLFNHK